jgi:hypothetical protein
MHEDGEPTVIKVGKTSMHPAERMSQLQTGNPRRLVIYRWIEVENHSEIEESIHREVSSQHIRGEWFQLTADAVDTICALVQSLHPESIVSDQYPRWTEDDIIAAAEKRVAGGKYRGDYSPRTAQRKKKEYWAAKNNTQPKGFSDDL